jgi:hypothetical protein
VTLWGSPAVNNFIDLYAPNPVVIGCYPGDQFLPDYDNLYGLPQHDGGDQWEKYPVGGLLLRPAVAADSNSAQYIFAVGNGDSLVISAGYPGKWTLFLGAALRPTPVGAASQGWVP